MQVGELHHMGLRRLDVSLGHEEPPEHEPETATLGVDPVRHARILVGEDHAEAAIGLELRVPRLRPAGRYAKS